VMDPQCNCNTVTYGVFSATVVVGQ
jgi:hypothetical protein